MNNFLPAALKWTRTEIDHEWKMVEQCIQDYVGNVPLPAGDAERTLSTLANLSRMFCLLGSTSAQLLCQEIGRVFYVLVSNKINGDKRTEAIDALIQSTLQMPYLLDYLSTGGKDVPEAVLPLLNTMRTVCGERKLRPVDVFRPILPETLSIPAEDADPSLLKTTAVSFDHWLKAGNQTDATTGVALGEQFACLASNHTHDRSKALLWTVGKVLEATSKNEFDAHVNVKYLLARVQKDMLLASGENKPFEHAYAHELLSQLLFYVGTEGDNSPALREVFEVFSLDNVVPTEQETHKAQAMLSGKNEQLLVAVGNAIKEDLVGVKDGLDIFLRTNDIERLADQQQVLKQVWETLSLVGLPAAQQVVEKQRAAIDSLVNGVRGKLLDDTQLRKQLLNVAEHLLGVDHQIDQQIAAFAATKTDSDAQSQHTVLTEVSASIAKTKHAAMDYVANPSQEKVQEMAALLNNVEGTLFVINMVEVAPLVHRLNEFVQNVWGQSAHYTPQQLQGWADALVAIEYYIEAKTDRLPTLPRIARFAAAALDTVQPVPTQERQKQPLPFPHDDLQEDTRQEETLADVPLETITQEIARVLSGPAESAAEQTASAPEPLASLSVFREPAFVKDIQEGFSPMGEHSSLVIAPGEREEAIHEQTPTPQEYAHQVPELERPELELSAMSGQWEMVDSVTRNPFEKPLEVMSVPQDDVEAAMDLELDFIAQSSARPIEVFDGAAPNQIDDNIREIFGEELQEEIDGLNEWLPQLHQTLSNQDLLYNIRKSFHTIKGSGRMVGAQTLGDLSWKVEDVLNQVRDGKRPLTPIVLDLMERGKEMFGYYFLAIHDPTVHWDSTTFGLWADQILEGVEYPYPSTSVVLPSFERSLSQPHGEPAPFGVENVDKPVVDSQPDAVFSTPFESEANNHEHDEQAQTEHPLDESHEHEQKKEWSGNFQLEEFAVSSFDIPEEALSAPAHILESEDKQDYELHLHLPAEFALDGVDEQEEQVLSFVLTVDEKGEGEYSDFAYTPPTEDNEEGLDNLWRRHEEEMGPAPTLPHSPVSPRTPPRALPEEPSLDLDAIDPDSLSLMDEYIPAPPPPPKPPAPEPVFDSAWSLEPISEDMPLHTPPPAFVREEAAARSGRPTHVVGRIDNIGVSAPKPAAVDIPVHIHFPNRTVESAPVPSTPVPSTPMPSTPMPVENHGANGKERGLDGQSLDKNGLNKNGLIENAFEDRAPTLPERIPERIVEEGIHGEDIIPVHLPPALPPYLSRATEWKIHLHYLYEIQGELMKVANALESGGALSNDDRAALQEVVWSLASRQSEALTMLRDTMMDHERKMARERARPAPAVAQPQPPAPAADMDKVEKKAVKPEPKKEVEVFAPQPKPSLWQQLLARFKKLPAASTKTK